MATIGYLVNPLATFFAKSFLDRYSAVSYTGPVAKTTAPITVAGKQLLDQMKEELGIPQQEMLGRILLWVSQQPPILRNQILGLLPADDDTVLRVMCESKGCYKDREPQARGSPGKQRRPRAS